LDGTFDPAELDDVDLERLLVPAAVYAVGLEGVFVDVDDVTEPMAAALLCFHGALVRAHNFAKSSSLGVADLFERRWLGKRY
jgi:hypothetical protein